jgi:threonine dehydrogenase-like Zn-dependent dehydrogenase
LSARCATGELFGWVEQGRGLHGGQAEFVRVPMADATLWPVPGGCNEELALLLCDVIPTGYYSARRADLAPHGVHVVIGCGPVGLAAVAAARRLGSQKLFAIDRVPARLTIAARFGATPIDLEREDAHAVIAAASDGRGADAVLEAVGNRSAARLAYELLRCGGTIASVGVHHADRLAFTPVEAYDKNLTYRSGRCPVRSLLPEIAAWIAADAPDFTSMITHRLPLSQALEGYRVFAARSDGCIKVVLSPGA